MTNPNTNYISNSFLKFFKIIFKGIPPKEVRNGSGQYKLCAFISHMGSSPHSGHYVAHVKRDDGLWYIFNDEKV